MQAGRPSLVAIAALHTHPLHLDVSSQHLIVSDHELRDMQRFTPFLLQQHPASGRVNPRAHRVVDPNINGPKVGLHELRKFADIGRLSNVCSSALDGDTVAGGQRRERGYRLLDAVA